MSLPFVCVESSLSDPQAGEAMKTYEGIVASDYADTEEDGSYWVGYMLDYTSINRIFDEFEDKKVRVTIEEIPE